MKDTELAQISLTKDHTGAIANPIYYQLTIQERTNPTRTAFEESFAKLEKGVASFATSSGMAAIQLVCNLLNLVMKY